MKLAVVSIKNLYFKPDNINGFSNDNDLLKQIYYYYYWGIITY